MPPMAAREPSTPVILVVEGEAGDGSNQWRTGVVRSCGDATPGSGTGPEEVATTDAAARYSRKFSGYTAATVDA